MSYCYNVMSHIYEERIRTHVPDQTVAILFETLIQEMHLANHRIGDAINHDHRVRTAARELDEYCLEYPLIEAKS